MLIIKAFMFLTFIGVGLIALLPKRDLEKIVDRLEKLVDKFN